MSDWFWQPVQPPPLRADISRRRREYRRHLAKVERTGWMTVSALLGLTAGALVALPPGTFS